MKKIFWLGAACFPVAAVLVLCFKFEPTTKYRITGIAGMSIGAMLFTWHSVRPSPKKK